MDLFIEHPALAAVIGGLFLAGYWASRRPTAAAAAAAWLGYSAYETGMRLRWLCTGECNIRLDLLAIYPVLVVLSLVALIALARRRLARQKS